jgi:methionyl-tRNA formyltransferase
MISVNFFGTHNFAVEILKTLIASGLFEIKTVVTAPDRLVGRHQKLQSSPIKLLAQKHNLSLEQPAVLKKPALKLPKTQLNIVCDYGLILPGELLSTAEQGSINIHPSLLPLYRGPAPIQNAILNGDQETGVTIMLMDEEMDHGPILAQKTLAIKPDETYPELAWRLVQIGGELLIKTLPDYLDNKIKPKPQDHKKATYTKMLKREDGKIDWTQSAKEIYNQYRALEPWPGVYTAEPVRIKLLKIKPGEKTNKAPGEFITDNKKLAIACGNGQSLEILELQPEGKKPMDPSAFRNGYLKK